MRFFKNLFFGAAIFFSSTIFAQKLLPWQQERLEGEITEMKKVMSLSEEQVKVVSRIKNEQSCAALKIFKSVKGGTIESSYAWGKHGAEYYSMLKEAVYDEQWKKWTKYVREKRKNELKENDEEDHRLSKVAMSIVESEITAMKEVMSLTEEQESVVRELKVDLAIAGERIYKTMKVGAEREQFWQILQDDTNKKIQQATSSEQMKLWMDSESRGSATKGL